MRKLAVLLLLPLLLPSLAAAETWKNVSLVDTHCAAKAKANPDAHTRACALQCRGFGYGVLTADGEYLRLDVAGNRQAEEVLKKSSQADHLRVNVTGERSGNTIKVQSLTL